MKIFAIKNNIKINIFLSLLVLWFSATQAMVVHSLYNAQVKVADYSASARQIAIQAGLQQVLIKVSGNSGVITLPQIQAKMSQAGSMVQRYSYTDQQDKNNQKTLLLQIKFDAKGVQQILRDANQSLWGKNRPLILVWLTVTDKQGNSLINDNSSIATYLKNNAKRRGLPIILPMLDLEDLNKITANDIETENLAAIKAASKRYNVNIILFGSISISPNAKWQSKWSLIDNASLNWDITGANINQVTAAVIDDVADSLANRYATLSNKALNKEITVIIDNINNLNFYVAVTKYLLNLTTVTKVELLSVTPTNIKLNIASMGGVTQLVQAINLDKKLIKSDADDIGYIATDAALFYKWVS